MKLQSIIMSSFHNSMMYNFKKVNLHIDAIQRLIFPPLTYYKNITKSIWNLLCACLFVYNVFL